MLNVIPWSPEKKIAIEYTQTKIRRELKCFTIKSQLNAEEDILAGNAGQKSCKTYRKQTAK